MYPNEELTLENVLAYFKERKEIATTHRNRSDKSQVDLAYWLGRQSEVISFYEWFNISLEDNY